MTSTRRGVILPVVLMILLLLGLLVAMFSLRVNADLASTQATAWRLQTRLAAEAGVERVRSMLRTSRFEMERWYNNPDELHRIVVWAPEGDEDSLGTNDDRFPDDAMVYRFSIVADDPSDDEERIRLGITDEASKLNINTATESQLFSLVAAATADREDLDPQAIVDAILDWRDADGTPRGEQGDTEGEYYKRLPKPYRVKNGPFDTVEEMLLVKGVTPAILYGEDWDRNGLLTANEDDGDETFPDDNQDGVLNRGLYPYLSTFSVENNVSNDNRPRISLQLPTDKLKAELAFVFPDEPDVVEYIASAAKPPAGDKKTPKTPAGQTPRGGKPQRPGAAPSAPQTPEPSQPGTSDPKNPKSPSGGKQGTQQKVTGGPEQPGSQPVNPRGKQPANPRQNPPATNPTTNPRQNPPATTPPTTPQGTPAATGGVGLEAEGELPPTGEEGGPEPLEDGEPEEAEADEKTPQQGSEKPEPLRSPASLLKPRTVDGQVQPNPLTLAHLPVLLDRLTVKKPEEKEIPGLINVNTASAAVLRCLQDDKGAPLLSDEQIEAIIQVRGALASSAMTTPAWLVAEEIVDLETFESIAPSITARGQQFTIESLGYADHMGMVTRLQAVVDMVGPIAQTIYYRDVTYVGGHFPIREQDLEKLRVH